MLKWIGSHLPQETNLPNVRRSLKCLIESDLESNEKFITVGMTASMLDVNFMNSFYSKHIEEVQIIDQVISSAIGELSED